MGTELRQPGSSVDNAALRELHATQDREAVRAALRTNPWSFGAFQLVRLLERLYPERKPVGIFVAPADEVVRFSAHTSLSFPASEIQSFTEAEGSPDRVSVNFMGLSTVNGPLPQPYVELLLERMRDKDFSTGEFFDIFNHRILSLFYRGWKKYRFYLAYEQPQGAEDLLLRCVSPLLGLGTAGLAGRLGVPDEAATFYAGILGQNRRTAQGLKQILEDFFDVRVEVEQFTGSWKRLPVTDQTAFRPAPAHSERLGIATVVGDQVWDQQGTATVRLGPMPLARYRDFLPGGAAAAQLAAWLRFYARGELDFQVRLVLQRAEVPEIRLTSDENDMARLGFASWLKLKPFTRDPEEAMYRL